MAFPAANTFCYAMTLTFVSLALNICSTSTSAVMSKSVPNLNEIEQSAAEVLIFFI